MDELVIVDSLNAAPEEPRRVSVFDSAIDLEAGEEERNRQSMEASSESEDTPNEDGTGSRVVQQQTLLKLIHRLRKSGKHGAVQQQQQWMTQYQQSVTELGSKAKVHLENAQRRSRRQRKQIQALYGALRENVQDWKAAEEQCERLRLEKQQIREALVDYLQGKGIAGGRSWYENMDVFGILSVWSHNVDTLLRQQDELKSCVQERTVAVSSLEREKEVEISNLHRAFEQLDDYAAKNRNLEATCQRLGETLGNLEASVERLTNERNQYKLEATQAQASATVSQSNVCQLQQDVQRLQTMHSEQEDKQTRLLEKCKELQAELTSKENDRLQLETVYKTLQQRYERLEAKNKETERQLDALDEQWMRETQHVSALQGQLETMRAQMGVLGEEKTSLQERVQQQADEIRSLRQRWEETTRNLRAHEHENAKLDESLQGCRTELQQSNHHVAELQKSHLQLNDTVNSLQTENNTISEWNTRLIQEQSTLNQKLQQTEEAWRASQETVKKLHVDKAEMTAQLRFFQYQIWNAIERQLKDGQKRSSGLETRSSSGGDSLQQRKTETWKTVASSLARLPDLMRSRILNLDHVVNSAGHLPEHSTKRKGRPLSMEENNRWMDVDVDEILQRGEHLTDNADLFAFPNILESVKRDLEKELAPLRLQLEPKTQQKSATISVAPHSAEHQET